MSDRAIPMPRTRLLAPEMADDSSGDDNIVSPQAVTSRGPWIANVISPDPAAWSIALTECIGAVRHPKCRHRGLSMIACDGRVGSIVVKRTRGWSGEPVLCGEAMTRPITS